MSISPKKRWRDGRVVYEVRLRDPAGREYSRTFDSRKAAEAYQTDRRAQHLRRTWVDPRRAEMPFEEVAAAWLKGGASKRGSGLARDESIVRNHLLPGWPGLGFHDPRRSNATVMVRSGVDVKTAQVRLGHSDPRVTPLVVYAQATTEADRTAAKRLGALLMQQPKPTKRRGPSR